MSVEPRRRLRAHLPYVGVLVLLALVALWVANGELGLRINPLVGFVLAYVAGLAALWPLRRGAPPEVTR